MSELYESTLTGAEIEAGIARAVATPHVTNQAQQFRHGFPNRTDTTLAFDNSSHVFTLGVATTATVYINGVPYTIASPGLTIDLDSKTLSAGLWFIWAEVSGGAVVLNAAKSAWDIEGLTAIPVATVFWNGAAGAIGEERHGDDRNLPMHKAWHKTVGARIVNDGSFAQTRPTTAADGNLELVAGALWDEDIENEITTAQGKLVRNWYETASGVWTWADGVNNAGYDRPYIWNGSTSLLRYPNTGSAYALTDCADNRYIPVWVYASNDIDRPIYVVTPALAAPYTTVANARAATAPVLPFAPELKLLYRWIYRGDGEYQEAADYRTASSLPSGGVSSPVAASVAFTPSGDIAATNVQAAIEELDDEKYAKTGGTIAAATLTGSTETSAVEVTQTWNTTGNPTLIKANVTNTASGATAKLLDLQVGSVSKFSVDDDGSVVLAGTTGIVIPSIGDTSNGIIFRTDGSNKFTYFRNNGVNTFGCAASSAYGIYLNSAYPLAWTSGAPGAAGTDAAIFRDAADVLGQRPAQGTGAQESRLYGSYTSATNYQRLSTKSVRQAITAAAGATLVSTISIPKYSHLIGVTTRVTTALGTSNGTTGYTVGDGTDADLWGVAATVTLGTTTDAASYTATDALGPDGSDRTITLTAVGGNFDGTGVIEVCAFYLRAEAD